MTKFVLRRWYDDILELGQITCVARACPCMNPRGAGHTAPKEMKGSVSRMTHRQQALLSWAAAAAVLLAGCRGGSRPGSMSGSSGSTGSAVTTQTSGWQTGLGVLTETSDEGRTGTIHTIAAAVLLDGEGKVADVMLDELEVELSADGKGAVTMPTDYRTKRQKGDDYPLAAASSLKKGWAEQADAFADYLTGLTPQQAARLETDKDGRAADPDLLSGCTIRVDKYRDAVAKACASAAPLGGAKGDRVSLGVAAENASSDVTATDDKDLNAEVELTFAALTLDADGRITSAIGDMAEPALTVAADGGITAPEAVRTKLELGDGYGMRGASALGKEWYEHSAGYCSYLKGKTEAEAASIPADGSDPDLAALCTISIDALQKAVGDAFENGSL